MNRVCGRDAQSRMEVLIGYSFFAAFCRLRTLIKIEKSRIACIMIQGGFVATFLAQNLILVAYCCSVFPVVRLF